MTAEQPAHPPNLRPPELVPDNYFDMALPEVRSIFAGCEFVWQPLIDLERRIRACVQPATVVRGSVMEGAYVSSNGVWIDEGAIVEPGTFITGPCFIGREAEVRQGAYIRGNVVLMDRAVLGHASEAKNAILLPGAKAPHFAYVGDSILGARVNLGAGTKLSNVGITSKKDSGTGHRPSITVLVDRNLYDTGLTKLGAVLGDDCSTGCNSVLNPGSFVGPRSLIYPNVSVRRGYYPADTILKLRQEIEQTPRESRPAEH